MPLDLSVVTPRSACPGCHTPIAAYDNIPVVSWLVLGGRCRHCKARISPRYAAVELLTGLLFALSFYLAARSEYLFPQQMLLAVKLSTLSFLLVGLIFTDAETKLLPDLLTFPGIALGLLFSFFLRVDGVSEWFLPRMNWRVLSFIDSLAGALLGAAFILGIALLYEAIRGVEGMGMGDVKLMALIGAFLGMKLTLVVLLIGSLAGSLFGLVLILFVWRKRYLRRRGKCPSEQPSSSRQRAWSSAQLIYRNFQIPFGVFLGAAGLLAAFCGAPLARWYWGLYP